MPNKKGCYLIWLDGYLTCTVQHRDYSKCDLNRPPEASEGKSQYAGKTDHISSTDFGSHRRPTPSALPTACFTAAELHILRTFTELRNWQEYCFPYSCFEAEGFTRKELVPAMKSLRERGYVQFERGLIDEEGQAAGSGYGVVYKRLDEIEKIVAENPRATQAQPQESSLRQQVLTEFKQVFKLAPADYTENCTNVVMSLLAAEYTRGAREELELRFDQLKAYGCPDHNESLKELWTQQLTKEPK